MLFIKQPRSDSCPALGAQPALAGGLGCAFSGAYSIFLALNPILSRATQRWVHSPLCLS